MQAEKGEKRTEVQKVKLNRKRNLNQHKGGRKKMSNGEHEIRTPKGLRIGNRSVVDGSKCILQLRGVRPFLSDKFDITKHKRYKELSDFDKKNAFDVERYLKHELRLRMDEEFDCYEVDVSEESTA
mgnify:CR=1 FL=1